MAKTFLIHTNYKIIYESIRSEWFSCRVWNLLFNTKLLIVGFTTYLSMVHHVYMPPNQNWFCILNNTILFTSMLCSTLFILSMTFDRFYSIIRPHKAASFNTVKRAKITIICVVTFCIMFNIPHLFISSHDGSQCLPYGKNMQYLHTQFYYWVSFNINFALPFVLLLIMNCVIIYTLHNRTVKNVHQGRGQSQGQKVKSSESQIYLILLLVTFAFLILSTPAYVFFLYAMFTDFHKSPMEFAGFYLYYNVAQKAQYTNHGINFFLYVLSGRKFRWDLVNLFNCKAKKQGKNDGGSTITSHAPLNDTSVQS